MVTPAGPEAVLSLDGAYLRSRHPRPEKTFEVVVAKLHQPEGRVSHVAFAGTESLGAERVRRLVRGAHLKEGTSLIALSDGAANLRALQRQGAPRALHLLDWFHVAMAMRFEHLLTAARALPDPEPNSPVDMRAWSEDLVRRAKWALWHGQSRKTRGHLEDLCGWTQAKQNSLAASGVTAGVHAVVGRLGRELLDYLWVNRYALPDYGEPHRAGRPIASSSAESAVNAVVAKRMNKKQQMRWNRYTVEPFLTVRTHVVDGTLEPTFWKTYPGHRQKTAAAASTS